MVSLAKKQVESEIHTNNVPEAFLKSRYGNQQYNYNFKENNPRIIERPKDRNDQSNKRTTVENIIGGKHGWYQTFAISNEIL